MDKKRNPLELSKKHALWLMLNGHTAS